MEQLHCSKQSVLLLARVRSGNRVSCNEFPVKGYGSEWQELAFGARSSQSRYSQQSAAEQGHRAGRERRRTCEP